MKGSFLARLASRILEDHSDDLSEITLILPTRRARIFLIEEFKRQLNKASWLPKILSMEDFIAELSDLTIADQLDLIFEFYQVYKDLEGKDAEALEDFMSWSNLLIYDFNEIDRNLINAKDLFGYLEAEKSLDLWSPDLENLSLNEKNYLDFWSKFHTYYDHLRDHLFRKGIAYQGMLYREAVDRVEEQSESLLDQKAYYFAGFNALTPAEEKIIQHIKYKRKVIRLWDADEYYLKDDDQEAGLFLRRQAERSDEFEWITDELLSQEKEIKIYGVSGNIGQAKVLAELLKESKQDADQKSLDKAVILADENLLLSVLESLPKEISPLNITMGYPVNQSSFYHFFYNYLNLFRLSEDRSQSFYHKDLFAFLEDPIFQIIYPQSKSLIQDLKEELKLFYNRSEIVELLSEPLKGLVEPSELLEKLLRMVDLLKNSGKLSDVEMEILYHFYKLFNQLKKQNESIQLSPKSLLSIYSQFISKSQLAFVGEPLNGLQIMGVLESRTLDFKEIFICSMNEGVLPSGKSQNSLIPFSIKQKFKIPSYREKDAIFAYHFYRILQGAEKVHLIYNNRFDPLGGGVRSRFIEQLLNEAKQKNPLIKIEEVRIKGIQAQAEATAEVIVKTPAIIDAIKKKIANGLSPSAINSYLSCPLNFYYQYILKLEEEKSLDPEEDIEDSLFGTLLHDCLEFLYKEYSSEILTEEHIDRIQKRSSQELENAFMKNGIKGWSKGKEKLIFEVCDQYLQLFFEMEKKRLEKGPIQLIEVERTHEWEGEIEILGEQVPLRLKGKIDRVEEQNGVKTIIDYKSGKVDNANLNPKDPPPILEDPENKLGKRIQLMIYKLLYNAESSEEYNAAIISFKNLSNGLIYANGLEEDTTKEELRLIIQDMLDPEKILEHNPKSRFCKFCRDL